MINGIGYSPEERDAIKERFIRCMEQDMPARDIVAEPGMVNLDTIFQWLKNDPKFWEAYRKARELQAESVELDIQRTAEQVRAGEIPSDVARVIIAAQQWRASKKNPKVYGDRTILAGDSENPLVSLSVRLDRALQLRQEKSKMIDVTPVIDNSQASDE